MSALLFIGLLGLFCCGQKSEDKVQVTMIDGISHIQNPENPIKGKVSLELEKTLEINPYSREDIGLRYFYSVKEKDGEVILFDPNRSEAHRYDSQGDYIGSLIRLGQGPGEFQQYHGLRIFFQNGQIWASSSVKRAVFDKNGNFIEEQKLTTAGTSSPSFFVDKNRFISRKSRWTDDGQLRKVVMFDLVSEAEVVFFEALREWLIRKGSSAFNDSWATPSIHYVYCPYTKRVYVAMNEAYRIHAKDLDGNTLYVIERPCKQVTVSRKDKEILIDWAVGNESWKWAFDAYPDKLAAIRNMAVLPRGYLAVYRITGPKQFAVDVYDPEGKYVYVLEFPEHISLERATFFASGFGTQETREDFPVYCEYRIKNLPKIFK